MTELELATCQCIIGHPQKAKFLAIKHRSGWAVPTLKFPAGSADYRAAMITQGMQQKYGLNTRVLRPLVSTSHYHCIELEICKGSGSKKLNAVWVDREQYEKTVEEPDAAHGAFDQWLYEKEQGIVPGLRPAWHIPGWFESADHWIHFQAEKLGLQITGSVQQFRVGWPSSCLLRARGSEGMLYFKAAPAKRPREANITMALAEKWPEFIVRPLAVDPERNWLLNRDLQATNSVSANSSLLPEFSRALATIQVGSMASTAEWTALGCPMHDLNYLLGWIDRKAELLPYLFQGPDPLTEPEAEKLAQALDAYVDTCRRLLEFDLPAALVHSDFRDDNLVVQKDGLRIIDWSGVELAHPFMVLSYLCSDRPRFYTENTAFFPNDAAGKALVGKIVSSYLDVFRARAPMQELEQAWALAYSLFPLWNLFKLHDELPWVESASPWHTLLTAKLKFHARKLMAIAEAATQQKN